MAVLHISCQNDKDRYTCLYFISTLPNNILVLVSLCSIEGIHLNFQQRLRAHYRQVLILEEAVARQLRVGSEQLDQSLISFTSTRGTHSGLYSFQIR